MVMTFQNPNPVSRTSSPEPRIPNPVPRILISTLLFLCSLSLHAEEESWGIDWGAVGQVATEVGTQLQKEVLTPERLDAWSEQSLGTIQNLLNNGNLEEIQAYAPYVHQVDTYLRQFPEAEPWLDWLHQRMDYFDYAEAHPSPAPPPAAPPPAQRTRSLPNPHGPVIADAPGAPPPKPRSAPPAMRSPSGDFDYWRGKIESRPAPKRAGALVPDLKRIFKENGVPPELVWLAEVESSFNPKAKSPVGARGLYQFMPATAEEYGLSTRPLDQRLNPTKSADAASRYLKKLYHRFDSWPLAIAAYNAGGGRVNKTLRQHQGNTFNDIAAHLPRETRMYVPKVLATVSVREGISPDQLSPAL